MKKLLISVLLIFGMQYVFAIENIKKPEVIHVKFNISDISKVNGKESLKEINNSIRLRKDNKWQQLGGNFGEHVLNGIHEPYANFMLSKLISSNEKNTTIQFMIIDIGNKQDNFIINPQMTVRYGQEAIMRINRDGHDIKIRALASLS